MIDLKELKKLETIPYFNKFGLFNSSHISFDLIPEQKNISIQNIFIRMNTSGKEPVIAIDSYSIKNPYHTMFFVFKDRIRTVTAPKISKYFHDLRYLYNVAKICQKAMVPNSVKFIRDLV